ncbi:MAG TPA: sigma 54-interacting transcriptional regulator [Kofleriaceae bacterium]|nr:sigma 54-interacting transcriptional regulator [Kofleriaceae bacterium]
MAIGSKPTWTDEQARAVLRVLEAVSRHRDREQLFVAIAGVLRSVFKFDALIVNLDGPGPDQMTPYFIHPRVAIPALQRSRSALERVFLTQEPIYIRSRADVADRPGSLEAMEKFGAHSYVGLPLVIGGKVLAALLLQSNRPNAYDDLDLPFATEIASAIAVALDNCLAYERIVQSRARLDAENQLLRAELRAAHLAGQMVAESSAMTEVKRLVELVAPTDATVLITGETGAGKERLARLIHERSARADRPMLAINCAAIPSSLIESELFGHEAGAFTGATRRRRGRFELANRGTLLLDEVGELAPDAQAKLLRVLQTQELERVGGSETLRVDVRVIAATNRPLTEMVEAREFRPDLYYRLAVFPIELPPLWARRDDVPILARQLVAESAQRLGIAPPHLDEQTIRELQRYSWPGNVRELQNVIERAVILSRGGLLDVAPLLDLSGLDAADEESDQDESTEGTEVRAALEASKWVIEGDDGAANRLGLRPSTLRSRMRRLGIERPR